MHNLHLANNNSANYFSYVFTSQSLFFVLTVPMYSIL